MNSSIHPLKEIPPRFVDSIVFLSLGGFLGATTRYVSTILFPTLFATIFVNTLGSFFIGILFYTGTFTERSNPMLHFLLVIGFLASFTTYSTFALETFLSPRFAMLNILLTYILGFVGVLFGKFISQKLQQGGL
ncbi:MAG TPA: CrcB family protein [Halobacteriales archaeon]|uniref:fluoride efflux transporter FluC n=1 Tax=Candidatus Hikarchaeum yamanae TaxID=2675326 RepID=UPI0017B03F73|nr:CrcB family protein [Halobacteriales archaeon]|tara:strand:+ start:865 stop:1266 length:402 start_codon:yes stop_codon:yes gene_type:complete